MQTGLCVGLLGLIGAAVAWPNTDFSKIGRDLIDASGVVTSNQVDTLVEVGDKLQQANKNLSDEQVYYLGRGVSAVILRSYPLLRENPGLTKYINQVGAALASRSSRPETFGGYHFGVLDTDEVNALSGPGGFVFISRGFLEIMPDEESLAAVLAHEIGHVILGHGVKAISNARLSEAALLLGKEAAASYGPSELGMVSDYFGDSVNEVADTLMKTGYSRSQEYEADAFAAQLLAQTGYSVRGLSRMLEQLHKVNGTARGGWMDTHPAPSERKASLKFPRQSIPEDIIQKRAARYSQALKPPPANPLGAFLQRFGLGAQK